MTPFQKLKRWIYFKTTPLRHRYTHWRLYRGQLIPLKILKFPHYVLSRPASPVTKFDQKLRILAQQMVNTMENVPWGKAAGLAAPQVGRSIRLFLAAGEAFVNPTIVASTYKLECHEGCFSLEANKFDYPVERAQSVWVKYQDLDGQWNKKKYNGFDAEVIQHEIQHLFGECLNSAELKQFWVKELYQKIVYEIKHKFLYGY